MLEWLQIRATHQHVVTWDGLLMCTIYKILLNMIFATKKTSTEQSQDLWPAEKKKKVNEAQLMHAVKNN